MSAISVFHRLIIINELPIQKTKSAFGNIVTTSISRQIGQCSRFLLMVSQPPPLFMLVRKRRFVFWEPM
ncbi:MAG TPA: hypothetical protein DD473_08900 [Planctomycetaceae bacterium]|nr:hypothetical protein [Planctomycetaceae bacterium]